MAATPIQEAFTGYLNGEEPYHSFFQEIAARSQSESRRDRTAARRAWLVFMRENCRDYLTRWPDSCAGLIRYLQVVLAQAQRLRADTRADAEAVLETARGFEQGAPSPA